MKRLPAVSPPAAQCSNVLLTCGFACGPIPAGPASIAPADSDIDVVVRPAEVDEDDDTWSASLEGWRRAVRRLTGNRAEVLEVSAREAAAKLGGLGQVWADIRRDGQVVHGLTIDELRAPHVG